MERKTNGKSGARSSRNGNTAVAEHGTPKSGEIELVTQEIARLVDASRQGRLEERGKPDQFHGCLLYTSRCV